MPPERDIQQHGHGEQRVQLRAQVQERRGDGGGEHGAEERRRRAAADTSQHPLQQAEGDDQDQPLPHHQAGHAEQLHPGVEQQIRQPLVVVPAAARFTEGPVVA
jgi:hypothetical protein